MPEIRNRIILRAIRLHYVGSPTISVYLDGAEVKIVDDLDSNSTYKTRTVTMPVGKVGFIPHVTSSSSDFTEITYITEDPQLFMEQRLWHYYEITFTGTVNVSLFLDEVLKVGDGDGLDSTKDRKTLVTTKNQNTVKVYLPPLSYGRVPHVLNDTDDTGEIISWLPIVLPARFYKTIQGASEGQITYKGECFVDFFVDGDRMGDTYHFPAIKDGNNNVIYSSSKFYLNDDLVGRVFQYRQVEGSGDILDIETDAHPLDLEPATVQTSD